MVNILIAEDDKDDFLLLQEALEKVLPEFHITHSQNGKEFLKQINDALSPDLIFLDLNMPKMNGIDCLTEIRQRKNLQATPVIIYSTSSDFQDIDICYKKGCTLYLVKPASFKDLVEKLKRILFKRAEEPVFKLEEQYRISPPGSSNFLFKMSKDWKEMYLLAGKNMADDPKQQETRYFLKNILPEDHLGMNATIQKAIATKSNFEVEHRVVNADGSIGWVFTRAVPVLDDKGEIIEWFGAAIDITERKNEEHELKEEHGFLEQVTNNTPHLIYVFDLDEQRFTYINRRIEELTGIKQDYVYGMGPHLFKMVMHPEDLTTSMDYLLGLSKLKKGEIKENEFRLKIGSNYKWFRSKDHIFKMEDGRVNQVIGLAEDINYEKRLQETLVNETGGVGLN